MGRDRYCFGESKVLIWGIKSTDLGNGEKYQNWEKSLYKSEGGWAMAKDSAREIVKFDNRFNSISVRGVGFKETEYKLLWYMCYKAIDQGTDVIKITFDALKQNGVLSKNYTRPELKKMLNDFYAKLKNFEYISDNYDENGNVQRWLVFYGYETHFENNEMDFKVTPQAVFFFNKLAKHFTVFEYKELLLLKTNDGINLFRQLKQWRTVGQVTFDIEFVRNFLDIPEDLPTKKVTQAVKTAVEDLKKNLPLTYANLSYKSIRRNKYIAGYTFTFDPEPQNELQGKNLVLNTVPAVVPYIPPKTIVSDENWEMPVLNELNKPSEQFVQQRKMMPFITEQDIASEWNCKVLDDYFASLEVVTRFIHIPIFQAKIKEYIEFMDKIGEPAEESLGTLLKAFSMITDVDIIYKINNCSIKEGNIVIKDAIEICNDKTVGKKVPYLRVVVENRFK